MQNKQGFYTQLFNDARAKNTMRAKVSTAIDWFKEASYLNTTGASEMRRILTQSATTAGNKKSAEQAFMPGHMYFFAYSAKHADTLPFWDAFPLIFPLEMSGTGFTGLNLHYLQPNLRAWMMDQLLEKTNNEKMDETTKLTLSYNIIKATSRYKAFMPCYKKYLVSHVRSKFIHVPSADWKTAIFLPVADWKNNSAQNVWKKTR